MYFTYLQFLILNIIIHIPTVSASPLTRGLPIFYGISASFTYFCFNWIQPFKSKYSIKAIIMGNINWLNYTLYLDSVIYKEFVSSLSTKTGI